MSLREIFSHVAPDGRTFTVREISCLHSDCWAAKCQCGTWLTKHDFTADNARDCALEVLARNDRWSHPRCAASSTDRAVAAVPETDTTNQEDR